MLPDEALKPLAAPPGRSEESLRASAGASASGPWPAAAPFCTAPIEADRAPLVTASMSLLAALKLLNDSLVNIPCTVETSAVVPAGSNGPLGPFSPQAASAPARAAAARNRTTGRRSIDRKSV